MRDAALRFVLLVGRESLLGPTYICMEQLATCIGEPWPCCSTARDG